MLTALEAATHAGFSPDRGTATFVAVIDERGVVIDLKLLSSTTSSKAGERGWEDVRQRAVRTLASAKIDMRGVKRAELQIAVESTVKLPSGNDPKAPPIQPTMKKSVTKIETNAPGSPAAPTSSRPRPSPSSTSPTSAQERHASSTQSSSRSRRSDSMLREPSGVRGGDEDHRLEYQLRRRRAPGRGVY